VWGVGVGVVGLVLGGGCVGVSLVRQEGGGVRVLPAGIK